MVRSSRNQVGLEQAKVVEHFARIAYGHYVGVVGLLQEALQKVEVRVLVVQDQYLGIKVRVIWHMWPLLVEVNTFPFQGVSYDRHEVLYVNWLGDICVCARTQEARGLAWSGIGADFDHRSVTGYWVLPQPLQDFLPVHIRKMQIQQNQDRDRACRPAQNRGFPALLIGV